MLQYHCSGHKEEKYEKKTTTTTTKAKEKKLSEEGDKERKKKKKKKKNDGGGKSEKRKSKRERSKEETDEDGDGPESTQKDESAAQTKVSLKKKKTSQKCDGEKKYRSVGSGELQLVIQWNVDPHSSGSSSSNRRNTTSLDGRSNQQATFIRLSRQLSLNVHCDDKFSHQYKEAMVVLLQKCWRGVRTRRMFAKQRTTSSI